MPPSVEISVTTVSALLVIPLGSVAVTVTAVAEPSSSMLAGLVLRVIGDALSLSVMVTVASATLKPVASPAMTMVSPVPSSMVSSVGSMSTVAVPLVEPPVIVIESSVPSAA